ncbi:MAG TPA: hypothetical protein VFG53_18025 [Anaeromyxobacter sp.]|nr:hypothetical protein [Anaeromyxobacter sp.]
MLRLSLLASALVLLTSPARGEDAGGAEGTIDTGNGRVELLARRIPVGERIELPEGWYRVEEEGVEDRDTGSFTVAAASSDEGTPAGRTPEEPPPPPPRRAGQVLGTPSSLLPLAVAVRIGCRDERNAYLRELWHESGIEVEDPDAVLRGLDAGAYGPGTGYYWFAFSTDAFRNLAWSTDLRDRARDLARCVEAQGR